MIFIALMALGVLCWVVSKQNDTPAAIQQCQHAFLRRNTSSEKISLQPRVASLRAHIPRKEERVASLRAHIPRIVPDV